MNSIASDDRVLGGLKKLPRKTNYHDPSSFNSMEHHLRPLMHEILSHNTSDIFIQEGIPIAVMVEGKMYAATYRPISQGEAHWFLGIICGQSALSTITDRRSINTAFSIFSNSGEKSSKGIRLRDKFRVNASGIRFDGASCFQLVLRTIPVDPPTYQQVGLNEVFVRRCCPNKGIVIIAGPTGEGKSTTLSAIIREILEGDTPIKGNIVTHEDPIEYVYDNIVSKHSIIAQSQIPECFATFGAANREAMRRKPAAILVGELRDRETIEAAIEASLTGHPVFATVHASSVTAIIQRLLTQYNKDEQSSALYNILDTSVMLISQRLTFKPDGKRMAVREHLYLTHELRSELLKIKDPLDINRRILELMENGSDDINAIASKTFKQQADDLLAKGEITEEGYIKLASGG